MDVGEQYNSWMVVAPAQPDALKKKRWLCRCECGTEKIIDAYNLISGRSKSCRKCSAAIVNGAKRTHGKSQTKLYRAWQSMKTRCYNENAERCYQYHGAEGIRVWDGWLENFPAFAAHIGEPPSSLHTVDRIDAWGHYEPGNVRWATQWEQMQNTRRSKKSRL